MRWASKPLVLKKELLGMLQDAAGMLELLVKGSLSKPVVLKKKLLDMLRDGAVGLQSAGAVMGDTNLVRVLGEHAC